MPLLVVADRSTLTSRNIRLASRSGHLKTEKEPTEAIELEARRIPEHFGTWMWGKHLHLGMLL